MIEDGELIPALHLKPKDGSYQQTGSWFVCRCGWNVSVYEQAFTGKTVTFCMQCYRSWLSRHRFRSKKDLDQWIDRRLWSIGEVLYQALLETTTDRKNGGAR